MRIGVVGPFNPASINNLFDVAVPTINETATAVNTLVKELLAQGHELKVYTLSVLMPNRYEVLRGNNVEVHLIPTGALTRVFGYHQLMAGQFFLPHRIARVIKAHIDYLDVLHAHWTYEYARACSMLSKHIPVFDTVRDWCPYQLSIMKGREKLDWFIKNITFRRVMADKRITFIANSSYTHRMILSEYSDKIVPIISNPIEKEWILDKKRKEVKHQIISIATGLCGPRKNIGTLIEAFVQYRKKYPDAKLHLVGGYDNMADNYKYWEANGWLEGVVFYGNLPHNELIELLDEMSFMVHPSIEETFGNILLEAMSRCVPCIGGKESGAVPEVLGYGRYGLLCDIHSAESVFMTMIEYDDDGVYSSIQHQATQMIKSTFSSEVIAKQHVALFQSVISSR